MQIVARNRQAFSGQLLHESGTSCSMGGPHAAATDGSGGPNFVGDCVRRASASQRDVLGNWILTCCCRSSDHPCQARARSTGAGDTTPLPSSRRPEAWDTAFHVYHAQFTAVEASTHSTRLQDSRCNVCCKAVVNWPPCNECSHSKTDSTEARACSTAFIKHVFPKFCRPTHRAVNGWRKFTLSS